MKVEFFDRCNWKNKKIFRENRGGIKKMYWRKSVVLWALRAGMGVFTGFVRNASFDIF